MKNQVMRWMFLSVLLLFLGLLITAMLTPIYAQSDGQQETVDAAVADYFTQTAVAYDDFVVSATARPDYNIAQTATSEFLTTVDSQFQNSVFETVSANQDAASTEARSLERSLSLTQISLDNLSQLVQIYALDGKDALMDADFSLSSRWLASGHFNGDIIIWDLETGDVAHLLSGHENPISAVMFSPDEQIIASADEKWFSEQDAIVTVRIWDTNTGQQLHTLYGHTETVAAMVFSSDGLRLVTLSEIGEVFVWNTLTGDLLYTLQTEIGRDFIAVAYAKYNDVVWIVDDANDIYIYELPNTDGQFFVLDDTHIVSRFSNFWWDVAEQDDFYNVRGDLLYTTAFIEDANTGVSRATLSRLLAINENNTMLAIADEGVVKILGLFTGARANEVASATAVFFNQLTTTAVQMNNTATATAEIQLTDIAATNEVPLTNIAATNEV